MINGHLALLGAAGLSFGQRVARSLQHCQHYLPARAVQFEQRTGGRQFAAMRLLDDGDQGGVEAERFPGTAIVPPVSRPGHEGVVVNVVPMFELEIRTVRGGPPGRVDPYPRRPTRTRAQQRDINGALACRPGTPECPVQNGDRAVGRLRRLAPRATGGERRWLLHHQAPVQDLFRKGTDFAFQRCPIRARHDEDGQVARTTDVGVRGPDLIEGPGRGHPHSGAAPSASWRSSSARNAAPALSSTDAVNSFSSGPPRLMRTSGRLESPKSPP